LKNSPAKIKVILGDARISLSQVKDKKYDILIIDAFSGDSIPIHLLTVEAIEQYQRCLTDKGIILFHVSNRYLYLSPVLTANACVVNAYICTQRNKDTPDGASASFWVALTWDDTMFNKLVNKLNWDFPQKSALRTGRPWTDKYSNLLKAIKLKDIFYSLKEFKVFYW
jgi:spermidine synthase